MANSFGSRARRVVVVVLAVYWLTIFVGTHLPTAGSGVARINDKVLHLGAYCGLSFLLCWTCLRRPNWKGLVAVLAVVAAYGGADEWSQTLVPPRTTEVADWIADVLGGVVGAAMYVLFAPLRRESAQVVRAVPQLVRKDAA